ncbi:MAG TPA: 30S ribosomal protein S16 [Candidatus Saccharimonadales bacterium]|nr:30S ribosomal protein S16 [Candidatus Saccharimonadales bacterium]
MLAIRLQRVGRKGHAMYRLAVQESQRHPSSGRVVAYVGTYDPHTKDAKVQVELAQKYLDNGAQPSPRVVKLLKDAGVKLPKWVVKFDNKQSKTVRNSEKLRKNRPAVEPVKPAEEKVEKVEKISDEKTDETPETTEVEEATETAAQE